MALNIIHLDRTVNLVRNNLSGIFWMIFKCLVFSIITILTSKLSKSIHAFEIFFLTMVVRLICILPWACITKHQVLKMNYPINYVWRSVLTTASLFSWFYALEISTGVIEATAISFTTPLFTVIAACLLLREQYDNKLIIALLIGFIGALIILKPNISTFGLSETLVLLTALLWALTDIITKVQARTENVGSQTLINTALMVVLSTPAAIYVWKQPTNNEWLYIIAIGVLFLANHLSLVMSYKAADLIVVAPFSYVRLLFTATLAYIFFGEVIDGYKLIGTMVILIANIYIIYNEKKLKLNAQI